METSWTGRSQPTTEWTSERDLVLNWDGMTMTWDNASLTWDEYPGGTSWTNRTQP